MEVSDLLIFLMPGIIFQLADSATVIHNLRSSGITGNYTLKSLAIEPNL